jgi:hypothetical protein
MRIETMVEINSEAELRIWKEIHDIVCSADEAIRPMDRSLLPENRVYDELRTIHDVVIFMQDEEMHFEDAN